VAFCTLATNENYLKDFDAAEFTSSPANEPKKISAPELRRAEAVAQAMIKRVLDERWDDSTWLTPGTTPVEIVDLALMVGAAVIHQRRDAQIRHRPEGITPRYKTLYRDADKALRNIMASDILINQDGSVARAVAGTSATTAYVYQSGGPIFSTIALENMADFRWDNQQDYF
jgi:hypothetical protein